MLRLNVYNREYYMTHQGFRTPKINGRTSTRVGTQTAADDVISKAAVASGPICSDVVSLQEVGDWGQASPSVQTRM